MKNIKPNASEKIHESTWITLAILGSTILITMYGETMLLPAISDIIRDFDISYNTFVMDSDGLLNFRSSHDAYSRKIIRHIW